MFTQHLRHLLFALLATCALVACGGSAEPIDPAGQASFEEPASEIDFEEYELQISCRGASARCCDRATGYCSNGKSCSITCRNAKGQITGEANCADAYCSTRPTGGVVAMDASCWCVAP